MSQYTGFARTNDFRVKDRAAFDKAIAESLADIDVNDAAGEGVDPALVYLICNEEGGWPSWAIGEDADGNDIDIEVDIASLVGEHLAPDSVAILQEVGYEKMRYLVGYAIAVDCHGSQQTVSIDDMLPLEHAGRVTPLPPATGTELANDIRQIVDYAWAPEAADFEEQADRTGHIFYVLQRLQAWLDADKGPAAKDGSPDATS